MTGLEALTQWATDALRQKRPEVKNVIVRYDQSHEIWYADLDGEKYEFPLLNGDDDSFFFVNISDANDIIDIPVPEDVLEEIVYGSGKSEAGG